MTQELIKYRISDSIHRHDPQAEAFLFGSRARGDHQLNSDWDILILVDNNKVTNEVEDQFRDDLYDIELESGQIISTFIYTKTYWNNTLIHTPLYYKIKKEGIKL
jgi:predicted nucleotidyltransferase